MRPDGGSTLDAAPQDGGADAAADDAATQDDGPPVDGGSRDTGGTDLGGDPSGPCQAWAAPASVGSAGDANLLEASGVVVGRADPSRLWLHNDSGDAAVLYALATADGAALGRWRMVGVDAVDFEDLAAAPCPGDGAPCLWVGDIGDNNQVRQNARLLVVPEPPPGDRPGPVLPRLTLPLQYPEGPVDAEALLVAPDGEAFWIIEKGAAEGQSRIFEGRGPFADEVPVVLTTVGSITAPGLLVTGADLSPDGRQVLVRTYTATTAYDLAEEQTPADLGAVAGRTAARGPLSEQQGEAVGFAEDGRSFWTVSEVRGSTDPPPVHFYRCTNPEAP
ncbi:MAG: hypothetical protein KC613_01000 [Myxococcales bacterium]|nr:hypothetical protein [Myxococcales bacterium]MCB9526465.1 hypothetical protein [Myxococcales bacterium]